MGIRVTMIALTRNQWEQWPWLLYLEDNKMRMKIEIIESVPILNCHACDTKLAVTRIVFSEKIAILLCKTCLYEVERLFYRQRNKNS